MSQSKCTEGSIRETDRIIKDKIICHDKLGKNSQILKTPVEKVTGNYKTKILMYWIIIVVQLSNGRLLKLNS